MSTILVNTLTGTSTAGSIAVTGEGNSTTTNLQQGLAKTFSRSVADGTSLGDSFNISSLSDDGTALQTLSLTNNMSSANYAAHVTGTNSFGSMVSDSHATNNYRTVARRFSDGALFDDIAQTSAVGDLA